MSLEAEAKFKQEVVSPQKLGEEEFDGPQKDDRMSPSIQYGINNITYIQSVIK